jgi:hypothetical protein
MKKITRATYKKDPYYESVVKAVDILLQKKSFVSPLELFTQMGLLSSKTMEDWKHGRIPYLEKVIGCNLSKCNRILRILAMHAHDLNLKPSMTVYKQWSKSSRTFLRFSKTGDHNIEEAYARHFIVPIKSDSQNGGKQNHAY